MKPAGDTLLDEKAALPESEGVAAVERALALVMAVADAEAPLTLAALAARSGFYKSTILRLLVSLIGAGYVTRLRDGRYELGPTAFRLGAAFERKNAIAHHVLPALHDLVARGTESASFHVRQDAEHRLCLLRVNSRHATLDRVEAGAVYPMHVGAAAHILRAFNGIDDARGATVRADGFALSLGERDPSCAAIAAPVFGPLNALVGALSLSGPRERFSTAEVETMRAQLLPAAAELTKTLGGVWPEFKFKSRGTRKPSPPGFRGR
jgi:DNA-binding IclR family transcriptional regulator